jgi:dipeptidyl aminopeptidase/acylaminoacyl peptidase
MLTRAKVITVVVLTLLAGCALEGGRHRSTQPGRSLELLYVDNTTLYSYRLSSGTRHKIAVLPSADLAVSPDRTHYVVVKETAPAGPGPEGFRKPVLVEARIAAGVGAHPVVLGPGRSPAWSPDGDRIAAVTSSRRRQNEVVVYTAGGAPHQGGTVTLPPDRWSILGWTQHRVVGLGAVSARVWLGDPVSRSRERLSLTPSEAWGVSPTSPELLRVAGGKTSLQRLRPGRPPIALHLGRALVGDGAWSPDGRWIAAVLLKRGSGLSLRSTLVVMDASSGRVRRVPESEGAQGNVVWSSAATSFAYVRSGRPRGTLEAIVCTTQLTCNPTFRWRRGISLLAL